MFIHLFFYAVVFFIVVLYVQQYIERHAFKSIRFDMKTDRKYAEAGEQVQLTTTVKNTGRLPVNYIAVTENMPVGISVDQTDSPAELTFDKSKETFSASFDLSLTNTFFLKGKSNFTITRKVHFNKRGRYLYHGATVSRGDFLGMYEYDGSFPLYEETVVFPKRAPLDRLPEIMSGLLGDISVRRFIFDDPVLTVGYNDYTGREPMKAISWTQSARLGKLMVKKYDYTTDLTVSVILNTECVRERLNMLSSAQISNIEYAISLTRSVCEYLDERRIPYSYMTNAALFGGRRLAVSLNSGFGKDHLYSVLENLGRTGYEVLESVGDTLFRAVMQSTSGSAFLIVTAEMTSALDREITLLQKTSPCVVLCASELIKEDAAYEE